MRLNLWHDMCEDVEDAIEKSKAPNKAADLTTLVVAMEKHRLLRLLLETAFVYQATPLERLMGFEEDGVRRLAEKYNLDIDEYNDWPKE